MKNHTHVVQRDPEIGLSIYITKEGSYLVINIVTRLLPTFSIHNALVPLVVPNPTVHEGRPCLSSVLCSSFPSARCFITTYLRSLLLVPKGRKSFSLSTYALSSTPLKLTGGSTELIMTSDCDKNFGSQCTLSHVI